MKTNDLIDAWKTNPIQTQSNPIQSQLKPIKCQNKPKTKPIQTQTKPISKAKNAAASVFKRGGTKGFDRVGLNVNENMDYKHNILLTDSEVSSESLSNKLRMGK